MPPSVRERLPETGQGREQAGEKDSSTTTEKVVERDSQPTADEGAAKVWSGIEEANQPSIPGDVFVSNAELFTVEDLSSVDNSLV